MNEIEKIVSYIEEIIYSGNIDINLLQDLLSKYYILSDKLNIKSEKLENLLLLIEENFIIDAKRKKYDLGEYDFQDIKEKIKNNESILLKEAEFIIKLSIQNTLENLYPITRELGGDVYNSSLKSFCDISQSISLIPLERLGLKVTKNNAFNDFKYPYNHSFGTVTFKINENGEIKDKTFLIDITYKQFFEVIYCNNGLYYKKENDEYLSPDPGYFTDKTFALNLLENCYFELNNQTAKLYGLPFYKSSLKLNQDVPCDINFYDAIINSKLDYICNYSEIEDFNLNLDENHKFLK